MQSKDKLIEFVKKLSNQDIIETDKNLFEYGILTSLDVLELINFLEKNYHIALNEDDVDMENFSTIEGMVTLVEKKVIDV